MKIDLSSTKMKESTGERKRMNEKKNAIMFVAVTHTGRFIMYSGIRKIYYRKTAGHVFTKRVQTEGTT